MNNSTSPTPYIQTKKMNKEKYFQILDNAKNDPNIDGVVMTKKRGVGMDATLKEYVAGLLKNGESVSLGCKEDNEEYINNYLKVLKDRHGVDCTYEKIYKHPLHRRWDESKADQFLGWKLILKTNPNE